MTAVEVHRLSSESGPAQACEWMVSLLCQVLGVGCAVLILFAEFPCILFLGGMGVLFVLSVFSRPVVRKLPFEIRMGSAGYHHDCRVVQ